MIPTLSAGHTVSAVGNGAYFQPLPSLTREKLAAGTPVCVCARVPLLPFITHFQGSKVLSQAEWYPPLADSGILGEL